MLAALLLALLQQIDAIKHSPLEWLADQLLAHCVCNANPEQLEPLHLRQGTKEYEAAVVSRPTVS